MKTLEASVNSALNDIWKYGGRYIKFELEANLNRGDSDDEESEYDDCEDCNGEGEVTCGCEDNPPPDGETCEDCQGNGLVQCESCEGSGRYYNEHEEGYSNNDCWEYIRQNISPECKEGTVYSHFYRDGSVDSELTVTVPLSWDGLWYWIEYTGAMVKLSEHIGNKIDVRGAGMHITILRSPDGNFPNGNGEMDKVKLGNFKTAMNRLMPALLLLASPDYKSRALFPFRQLGVGQGDHRNAIDIAGHGRAGGIFEWRVFETCYDRPEMVFDYICTIAKGLKFYSNKPPEMNLERIGKLTFVDDGRAYGIHKYYTTEKHLKALDIGLDWLKPDHRSKAEVYRLRNFTLNAERLAKKRIKAMELIEPEWVEYRQTREQKREEYVQYRVERETRHPFSTWDSSGIDGLKAMMAQEFDRANPKTKRAYINRRLMRNLQSQTITI